MPPSSAEWSCVVGTFTIPHVVVCAFRHIFEGLRGVLRRGKLAMTPALAGRDAPPTTSSNAAKHTPSRALNAGPSRGETRTSESRKGEAHIAERSERATRCVSPTQSVLQKKQQGKQEINKNQQRATEEKMQKWGSRVHVRRSPGSGLSQGSDIVRWHRLRVGAVVAHRMALSEWRCVTAD